MKDDKISEKIFKGDAGTAGSKPESTSTSVPPDDGMDPAVVGTEKDVSGRFIPLGEPLDDIRVRELGRYFDVTASQFRDAGKDLAEILQFVSELTQQTSMSDLLVTISEMEKAIRPAHATVPRYIHFRNYLLEKMAAYDVRKRVSAWENNSSVI